MLQNEFWVNLEYRLCRELREMTDQRLRHLWCDGFVPDEFLGNGIPPCVKGHVWICDQQRQESWRFTLLLPCQHASLKDVEWADLIPSEDDHKWLWMDLIARELRIDSLSKR